MHHPLMHVKESRSMDISFKLISFYDNEWGYTNQIFRLIKHMYQVDNGIK